MINSVGLFVSPTNNTVKAPSHLSQQTWGAYLLSSTATTEVLLEMLGSKHTLKKFI